jgi:hypothetical protein
MRTARLCPNAGRWYLAKHQEPGCTPLWRYPANAAKATEQTAQPTSWWGIEASPTRSIGVGPRPHRKRRRPKP